MSFFNNSIFLYILYSIVQRETCLFGFWSFPIADNKEEEDFKSGASQPGTPLSLLTQFLARCL
jgi:hypothetical protein